MIQCYYEYPADEKGKRKRCDKKSDPSIGFFCCKEHQLEWRLENYGMSRLYKKNTKANLLQRVAVLRKNAYGQKSVK